ncbi:ABC transporter substrate-binding protein [Mesorhizobium sp. DCY119]|uniref:ABC transporter substrate-binding protein n=1 Tax=Mesorhizobium sp. DCY119 TaxID=2108445 RepID=UPI00140250A1|nr:ABC transporter substrate-binding protein [Mesorhizobium sp. DCY119]
MFSMARRRILLGATAFAVGTVAAFSAAAQDVTKLRISIQPIIDLTPLFIAQKFGYFAEEGLEVDTSPTSGAATGIPGLIGGAYDITFGAAVSSLLAFSQGLEIEVISPGTQMIRKPSPSLIVGKRDDSWATPADFVGKSIAVNTRNSIVWLYAQAWVEARGAKIEDVVFREVGFPQMGDAIIQDQVDAAFMVEPFKGAALQDPGLVVIGDPFAEAQPGADAGNYVTTKAFAAEHPQVIAKFRNAIRRAVDWYNANRTTDENYKIISGFTNLPVETLKKIDLPEFPLISNKGELTATAELMVRYGMIEAVPDIEAYVNPIATK